MTAKINDKLLELVNQNLKAQRIRVTREVFQEYYDYLSYYALSPMPPVSQVNGKLQFLGRIIEIYEETSTTDQG